MATPSPRPAAPGRRRRRRPRRRRRRRCRSGWPCVATSLPMFMATLDNLVMTSALPVIRADLGASVDSSPGS